MRVNAVFYLTLLLNAIFFVLNLVVALVGGSRAVLSQAVYAGTDMVATLMVVWGQMAGALPPSARHPFGRGKERFFWTFVAGLIAFTLAGALVFTEGLQAVGHPGAIGDLGLSLGTVVGTLVAALASLGIVLAEMRRDHLSVSALLESTQQGVKTLFLQDVVSIAGAVVAVTGLALVARTGHAVFDGLAATVVGALLLVTGFAIAAETRELLVGRSISAGEARALLALVERYPYVRSVRGMQSMLLGPDDALVALRVNFIDEMTTDDMELHIDQLRRFVRGEFPHIQHLVIEPVGEEPVRRTRRPTLPFPRRQARASDEPSRTLR